MSSVFVHHHDGGEFAEKVLQSAGVGDLDLADDEVVLRDPHAMNPLVQYRFDEGGSRFVRRVDHEPLADRRCDRPADSGVGLPDDDPGVGSKFLHQQRRLQAPKIVILHADDSQRARQSSSPETVRVTRAPTDPGHIQGLHGP